MRLETRLPGRVRVAALATALACACSAGGGEEERALMRQALLAPPVALEIRELPPPATLGVSADADAPMSTVRALSQQEPWHDGRVRRYVVIEEGREQARAESLLRRVEHRAFDGAPPVVPHDLSWGARDGCLTCHGAGMTIGDRIARRPSHAELTNCTQCHVAHDNPFVPDSPAPAINTFVGLPSPGPGPRSFDGVPPVIPHTTLMRTRCLSCHGELGYPGLRTDHPTRSSCVQCHVGR